VGDQPVAPRWVWVLRHAKAAAHGPDDHSRVLAPRGTRQATAAGRSVAADPVDGAPVPTLVLCSSARRAVQTAELVVAELADRPELDVERGLYEADADDVVDRLRLVDDEVVSVMVVGHNPTLHDLALLLLQPQDAAGRSRLEAGFPTSALAVVGTGAPSWGQLEVGTGRLLALRTPGR
jgi:phosphohistidine phosphatase